MICSFHSKFPTQNPPRSTQKNPFCIQIKYDTTYNFTFCRRLADEGDSKSLVLITRVGSTPTTGIKRKPLSLSGGLSFYLRRVSGSNSTTLHSRESNQPCGLLLSARETPTTGIASSSKSKGFGLLFFFIPRIRLIFTLLSPLGRY